MGLVLGFILIGYVAVCGGVVAFMCHFIRQNTRRGLVVSVIIFLMVWPIWFPLLSWFFFEATCKFGDHGMYFVKPYKIDSFAIGNRMQYSGIYGTNFWKGSDDFLKNCDDYCSDEINRIFYEGTPWSSIRNDKIIFEESWYFQKNKFDEKERKTVKHGRFWIAQSGASDCLVPLYKKWKERDLSMCIAGKEIPSISASYVIQVYPFFQDIPYSGETNPYVTSRKWKIFYVSKFEHQLLNHGDLVAKYVWYEWDFLPFFGLEDSYPIKSNPGNNVYEDFFGIILSSENQMNNWH